MGHPITARDSVGAVLCVRRSWLDERSEMIDSEFLADAARRLTLEGQYVDAADMLRLWRRTEGLCEHCALHHPSDECPRRIYGVEPLSTERAGRLLRMATT